MTLSEKPAHLAPSAISNASLPSEAEVMRDWPQGTDIPTVSICCTAFNHVRFIEQAIQGFLVQRTRFRFEILLHDDASTDGTADIIRNYAQRYPRLIRPVLQQQNQYSQGRRILEILTPMCRGEYIAQCDGDDFWLDPDKLQIQVDFLSSHPDYVLSGHDAQIANEHGELIGKPKLSGRRRRDFTGEEMIRGKASMPTMSRVYRNVIRQFPPERSMVKNGDMFLMSLLGHFGDGHFHTDIQPAVYRVHAGGIWSMMPREERVEEHINTYYWMYRYYRRIGEHAHARYFWQRFVAYVFRRGSSLELTLALLRKWFHRERT